MPLSLELVPFTHGDLNPGMYEPGDPRAEEFRDCDVLLFSGKKRVGKVTIHLVDRHPGGTPVEKLGKCNYYAIKGPWSGSKLIKYPHEDTFIGEVEHVLGWVENKWQQWLYDCNLKEYPSKCPNP